VDLGCFFGFLICKQSVGLFERRISPSQGRYLHTATQTEETTHTEWIRTHDPSAWAGEDGSCLRPRGHCDRHIKFSFNIIWSRDGSEIIIDKFINQLTIRAQLFVRKRKLLSWIISPFIEAELLYPLHNYPSLEEHSRSQINPVHNVKTHLFKLHFNIIIPSAPSYPMWSLQFLFEHKVR
jgi:hypothetical protein